MVAIGIYILHLQATKDGGLLIRAWRSRRWLNWLICLLRKWVSFRLHMAGDQWGQAGRIFGGAAEPLRFTEGKARCWWEGGTLRSHMGKWGLDMTREEAVRLNEALAKVGPR
jgi:hypothetical protein